MLAVLDGFPLPSAPNRFLANRLYIADIKRKAHISVGFIIWLVRKGGFEPPRLTAPPPQDGASASSATSARGDEEFYCLRPGCIVRAFHKRPYFAGAGAGAAGVAGAGADTGTAGAAGASGAAGVFDVFENCC